MRKVAALLREIELERGAQSEEMVKRALREMKDGGEIVGFYKAGSRADSFEGIDFVVIGLDGGKISFQVKSSLTGARKHQKRFPNIPVIVVGAESSESSVKNDIERFLGTQIT